MSVAELQLLNKVLQDKSYSVILDNNITEEYFTVGKEEFNYLKKFYEEYDGVPDTQDFINNFPKWELFKVEQSTRSIVDTLKEATIFRRAVKLINDSTKLFEADANKGAKFLLEHINELQLADSFDCDDVVHSMSAYNQWKEMKENPEAFTIPFPLKEVAEDIGGYRRGEELFLWLSRSNRGKSWFLALTADVASKAGFRVGIISPEMLASTFATRIQTVRSNISNTGINRGYAVNGYEEFVKKWDKSDEHIFVADTTHFKEGISVQDCEKFIKSKKLDMLLIDGVSYIKPGIKARLSTTEVLGKTCEGLLALSSKYKIPVVGVVQARRKTTAGEDAEDIDEQSAFNSYMLTQICTRMVSISKVADGLKIKIVKNRYGIVDKEWVYTPDFDRGILTYVPDKEDVEDDEELQETAKSLKLSF